MSTIWIPIVVTILFGAALRADYKNCSNVVLPSWPQIVLGLLINPGIALIAIWWLWVLLK